MPTLKPLGSTYGCAAPALGERQVADPALEPADGHRLQGVADRADAFALVFLGAHPPADRRQQVCVGEDVVGAAEVLLGEIFSMKPGMSIATGQALRYRRVPGHTRQRSASFSASLEPDNPAQLHRSSATRSAGSCTGIGVAFLGNGPDRLLLRHLVRRHSRWRFVASGPVLTPISPWPRHPTRLPPDFEGHRFSCWVFETSQPAHQIIEVDLVAVELGTVDTGKLGLERIDLHTAAAAHSGPVDHDRIQAHHCLNARECA